MIYADVTATVGRTPLVELARLASGLPGRLLAKLEMRNPCSSVKDRLGLALIEDAEARGLLRPGATSSRRRAEIPASVSPAPRQSEAIG